MWDKRGAKDTSKSGNLDGSLAELIKEIYATADIDSNFKEYVDSGTMFVEVNEENVEYHLGKADIEFEEALASEPIMQPGAYSLVLVRVKGADIETIKNEIKENVDLSNGMRWVAEETL